MCGGFAAFLALPLSFAFPQRAKAFAWSVAIQALSATLGVISAFSKGDGGLAAILNAHTALLNLAIQSLNEIQTSLAQLNALVATLPQQIREIVAQQYRNSLISQIGGHASQYSVFLAASQNDSTVFASDSVRTQLQFIHHDCSLARSTLAGTKEGSGPEAALIIPIACALELATTERLAFPNSVAAEKLAQYQRWCQAVIADREGSAQAAIKVAADAHDELIDKLAKNTWIAALGIKEFKLAGNQTGTPAADCLLLSDWHIFGDTADNKIPAAAVRKAGDMASYMVDRPIHSFYRDFSLQARVDPKIGFLSIELNDKQPKVATFRRPHLIEGDLPPSGECIVLDQSNYSRLATLRTENLTETVDWVLEQRNIERGQVTAKAFKDILDDLNLYRARMIFAAGAVSIAMKTIDRIRAHRATLS